MYYETSSQDTNELVLKLRQVQQYLSRKNMKHNIISNSIHSCIISTQETIEDPEILNHLTPTEAPSLTHSQHPQYVLSANPEIYENLLLKGKDYGFPISEQNTVVF